VSLVIGILLTHQRLAEEDTDSAPPETEASGDVVAQWLATLAGLVEEHGSLEAVREWQRAEEHRRLEAQLERNRSVRDAAMASARDARLDPETRAILRAAEAYLRESSDA
jgi:tellurite resistance protein